MLYLSVMLIHCLAALAIIGLVLLQQGRGSAMGSAFGAGASQTVFGSRGAGATLLKITIGFGMIFFVTSLSLNYMATRAVKQTRVVVLLPASEVKKPLLPEVPTPSSIPGLAPAQSSSQ